LPAPDQHPGDFAHDRPADAAAGARSSRAGSAQRMVDVERLRQVLNAPLNAATALSRSEYVVMMITGSCG
jgi:hypothetical protein